MDHPDHIRTLITAKNPVYGNPQHTTVVLDCHFLELKELGHVKFHAHDGDVHDHGRDILQRALAGEFGPVKPYPISLIDQLIAYASAKRDGIEKRGVSVDGVIVADDRARTLLNSAHIRADKDSAYTMPWPQNAKVIMLSAAQIIKISDAVHSQHHKLTHAFAGALAGINAKEITTRVQVDTIFSSVQ